MDSSEYGIENQGVAGSAGALIPSYLKAKQMQINEVCNIDYKAALHLLSVIIAKSPLSVNITYTEIKVF